MAELNFGLLTPPGSQSVGNAFVSGMDQAAAARAQENQNALSQYTLSKAKREDELTNQLLGDLRGATTDAEIYRAYQRAGKGDVASKLRGEALTQDELRNKIKAQPGLMARTEAQTEADKARTIRENATYAYETISRLATLPEGATDQDITAAISDAGSRGLLSMQEATRVQTALLNATPEKRRESLLLMGADAAKRLQALTPDIRQVTTPTGGVDLINFAPFSPGFGQTPAGVRNYAPGMTQSQSGMLTVARQNAATNQARVELQKLGLVDPEGIELVATAVGEGRLPVDRLNGNTASMFARLLKATPDLDFTKLSVDQAGGRASAVSNARIASRQTLTDVDATQAENISRGNLPPATGPNAAKIMNEVIRINPEYNSRDFGLQTAAEKEFNIGKDGNKTRSLNVAVSHLATLDTAATALNAGDIRMFNQFKQAWQRETGKTAPTNFNAVRELVADEIVAAVVPGVGALADRKALKETILSRSSPAQIQGVIKEYKELLGGQLVGLEKQYNASTRKTDFRQRYLTPEAIAALTPGQTAPPAGAARPAGVGPNWTFETDAAGNSAWVSPDRKSFKEAQ